MDLAFWTLLFVKYKVNLVKFTGLLKSCMFGGLFFPWPLDLDHSSSLFGRNPCVPLFLGALGHVALEKQSEMDMKNFKH